jgi:hypothetical protein
MTQPSPILTKYEPKACERCNKNHICTGTSNCQCFEVEITDILLDYLACHYEDCLCRDCLKEMKQNNALVS